jgi:hypothetical protein
MNFLPENYEYAVKPKAYWKMSEMQQGDNRFRIVQKPIAGWIDWKDNRPVRYPPKNRPAKPFDPEKEVKSFWSCYVWDYARRDLFILEITQASIIKALVNLAKDEEWGDFTLYDLKLRKEGAGQMTKYLLSPLPPKPIAEEIKLALQIRPAYLEALYIGGDPWAEPLEGALKSINGGAELPSYVSSHQIDSRPNKGPSSAFPERGALDELKERLELERVPINRLEEWVKARAQTKGESAEAVIHSCLEPALFPKFVHSFVKWLEIKQPMPIAV